MTAGLKNTDQNALGMRSTRGAIPTPDLASHHHGANGLFGSPVGGFQPRTDQEKKQGVSFPQQMIGQASIPQRTIATFQASVQPRFQSAAGHRHSSLADLPLVAAIPQLQSVREDGFHRARELRLAFSRYQDHFSTAPQQMRQAGLVQRLDKLTIDDPAIPHQKACEVRSQHRGRLFKSSPGLNRIDGHLGGAESPHPPQMSAHSPTRLVRSDTRATANFFDQGFIGRFRFMGYPVHRLAQTAPTDLQSEGLLEHRGRFAVG